MEEMIEEYEEERKEMEAKFERSLNDHSLTMIERDKL